MRILVAIGFGVLIAGVVLSLAACSSRCPDTGAEYENDNVFDGVWGITLYPDGSYEEACGWRTFRGTWRREGDRLILQSDRNGGPPDEPEVCVPDGNRFRLERGGEVMYLDLPQRR